MVLFARTPGNAPVTGHLVELVQIAFEAQGCPTGGTDGVFGRGTERAVRRWQIRNGFRETGVIVAGEWEVLTGLPQPGVRDLCLQATAAIEGHGFTKAVGNFDGAGLTWGCMGFALTGGLPSLLEAIDGDEEAGPRARGVFGADRWDTLLRAASGDRAEKQAFGDSISLGAKRVRLRADWDAAFEQLGRLPAVQRLQLEASAPYWERAVAAAERYDARDLHDLGLIYDACIQHGSISGERRERMDRVAPGGVPAERRRAWADAMADATPARWRERVRDRRRLFADGAGVVHGGRYDLADWGFLQPLPPRDELAAAGVTARPANFQGPEPGARRPAPAVQAAVDWLEEVAVPEGLNLGLNHAPNSYLIARLGMPRGDFDQRCRPPTNRAFRALCDFGFTLPQLGRIGWALLPAKESFAEVVAEIARRQPAVYDLMGQVGMGCCRYVRGSTSSISAHAFGTAIDVTLGGAVDPYNNDRVMRGMIEVIQVANEFGWYSGAYYRREDCMHLEASRELLDEWVAAGRLRAPAGSNVPPMTRMMQQGHRGEEVRALQRMLNRTGAALVPDGMFGPAVTAALKAFQTIAGLAPDGIAGPRTMAALRTAAEEPAAPVA